jgi:hypothetical protein
MGVDQVASSCGFGVPLFEYLGQRDMLPEWADKKGSKGLEEFIKKHNTQSIDGKPTDIG